MFKVQCDDYCEVFSLVSEAIKSVIRHWPEQEQKEVYTIRNEKGMLMATITPFKKNAVVVMNDGTVHQYLDIQYRRNANGKLETYADIAVFTDSTITPNVKV